MWHRTISIHGFILREQCYWRAVYGVRITTPIPFFSRGLWTWSPWMICAPTFNHKIGNAAYPIVSEVLFFTKSYNWKKQQWKKWKTGRLLLETMCFWRSPTVRQFKMAGRRMRAKHKLTLLDVAWQCPDQSMLFPCSISFAEGFVTCLRNKAHAYVLTYPRQS